MVHRNQRIKSDGETFKVLHVCKGKFEEERQTDVMDRFHEKLGCRIYGMGHDGKLIVAVKV